MKTKTALLQIRIAPILRRKLNAKARKMGITLKTLMMPYIVIAADQRHGENK